MKQALEKFRDLIVNVVNDIHGVISPFRIIDTEDTSPTKIFSDSKENFDLVNSAKFEYFRNLRDYPYPVNSSEYSKYEQEIINRVALTLNHLEKENSNPLISNVTCIKYSEDTETFNKIIDENKIKIFSSDSDKNKLVLFVLKSDINVSSLILVNDSSHVRIISTTKNHEYIFSCYENLYHIHKALDFQLHFEFDNHLGYLNSNISLLGNALKFSSDVMMTKLYKNDNATFEEVKLKFNGHSDSYSSLISFSISQNLNETENDFLNRVFQHIYNLNYIECNVNDAKIQNSIHKIEEYEKKAVSYREKKFYNSLKLAYETSLINYLYSHFYQFNITLNTIILNISKQVNMVNIYRHFPNFFNSFLMNYRQVYDDVINRKTLSNVSKNLEDFRDSLSNLENFSLNCTKKLNFTIRRNLHFGVHGDSEAEEEIHTSKIISECVKYVSTVLTQQSEFNEDSNTYFFCNSQIGIHVNRLDILTFTLNVSENSDELIKLINIFFKIYKEISFKLNESKITYASSPSTGYYTSDLSYLGTGLTYLIELTNPDNLEFSLNAIHEKDGFYVEKTNDSILLGCNLNVNIGIYRIFNVTIELFKHLKILTVTEKSKKTNDFLPVEPIEEA